MNKATTLYEAVYYGAVAIFERDGWHCRRCGAMDPLEIDHIVPISKGGKSVYENLQTLCHRCNQEKGSD